MSKLTFRDCLLKIKPYVPGKPIEEVKRELGLAEVIKIASNENPIGPSKKAVEAMGKALDNTHIYPDGAAFELKEKLAKKLSLKPENIIFGTGGDEIIFYFAYSFLANKNNIVVPNCTFAEYATSATIMDSQIKTVPVRDDWQIDLDAMLKEVDKNTKAVYITNPNNPTGAIISADKIEDFMDKLPEDCITFIDEAYYEYVDDPNYTKALEWIIKDRNIVILRTFSKIYGLAGLRIGYAMTPERIISIMERVRLPFNTSSLAQVAAIAALDDNEHIISSRETNSKGKEYLYSEFEKLGLTYTKTNANFVWVDTFKNCKEVFNQLLKRGVIVRTGDIFGAETYIRVTIGTEKELKKFVKELKEVLAS